MSGDFKMRSFKVCTQTIIRANKSGRMRWAGFVTTWGRREVHTEFWWEDPKERDNVEVLDVGGRIILKWVFKKSFGFRGLGLSGSGYGKYGGLLWMRWWNFRFHKIRRIYLLAEELLVSQGGLYSMELGVFSCKTTNVVIIIYYYYYLLLY